MAPPEGNAAAGTAEPPLISVITVNRDGARFLPDLLDSLARQTWPRLEVLVVDNASSDGSAELVRRRYPWARLVETGANLGFVGGNNAGFAAARGELLALINNDTVVAPDWLERLAAEAAAAPQVGAVASKILFARPFLPVHLEIEPFVPAERGGGADRRSLGVRLSETMSGFEGCAYVKPIFRDGFYGPEPGDGEVWRWSAGRASLDLPIEHRDRPAVLRLRLAGGVPGRRVLRVRVGEGPATELEVGPEAGEHRVEVPLETVRRDAYEVINNAGSFLGPDGVAGDRGIFEPDRGQLDRGEEVGAFCGCSVLLRREALDRAGVFDRDYFMYFEDTELSWRLRKAGYRIRYQPASVVWHRHAGSSGEWSPLFVFLVTRNRILMLLKHAAPGRALGAWLEEVARTLRLLARRGTLGLARPRLRAQLSLVALAPRALLKRLGLLAD